MSQHGPSVQRPHVGGVTLPPTPHQEVRVRLRGLTVEHGIYGTLFLFALLTRLLWLGKRPLSPAEAKLAWLAWHNTQPAPYLPVVDVSPLGYALLWITFLLTGGSDALARLWPALAGSVTVLVPYFLREHIGRYRALLASLLLATSAQFTYWSRHASGTSFLVLASLVLLVGLWNWLHEEEGRRWVYAIAVAMAVALATSPLAYNVVLAFGVALWPWRRVMLTRWRAVAPGERRVAGLAFGLTLLGTGTVFLTDVPAFAAVSDLLGLWVQRFWTSAGYPWYWVPWRLAADEPLLLAFGIWGAWRVWRHRDAFGRLCLTWTVVVLALSVGQAGRTSEDVAIAVVPLAFLAADGLAQAIRLWRTPSPTWREEAMLAAAYFVLLGFWFMMAAGYLRVGDARYLIALAAVPLLLTGLTVLNAFWLSPNAAYRVLTFSLLVTAAMWSWMALWVQNFHLAEDAALDALPGVEREVTHPNIRLLVQTLERISAQRVSDPHEVQVDLLDPQGDPVLRWYLRRFVNLRVVESTRAIGAAVVITPENVDVLPGYTGMVWAVGQALLPTELGGYMYHWWFYREALRPGPLRRVVLWVKPPTAGRP